MSKATVRLVSVRVDDFALLVFPTVTEPKFRVEGTSVAVGSAAVPNPFRLMVCLPLLVLSSTVTVAERAPEAVGVKVTVIRHVFKGLSVPEVGQVVADVI